MKKKCFISIAAFIMLSCMASSPQQSLQSRLFGTWAASGDEVAVFQIDKDSLYYIDEDPIVAISYQFAGDSMSLDYWGNTIVQHISFRKDTLVMKNKLGEVNCFVPVKWAMIDYIREAHVYNYYALAEFGIHDIAFPLSRWISSNADL